MNAGGWQGGGQGGEGGQAGGGGGPTQATSTSAQVNSITSASGFATSTVPHFIPSASIISSASASASASANDTSRGIPASMANIAVGVALGVVVLIAIGCLVAYMKGWMPCWTKKRREKLAEKAEKLNDPSSLRWFAPQMSPMFLQPWNGTRFGTRQGTRQNSIRLSRGLPTHTSSIPGVVPTQPFGVPRVLDPVSETRDLEANHRTSAEERNSADYFLPTYAQSQSGMSELGRASLRPLNTSNTAPSEASVSPLTPEEGGNNAFTSSQTDGAAFMSPQTTGYTEVSIISPQTTGQTTTELRLLFPEYASDASGYSIPADPQSQVAPIVAPIPVRQVHQGSLERAARDGMIRPSPASQDPSRLMSGDTIAGSRESGVLGDQNPVTVVSSGPPLTHVSQSTVARNVSVSSAYSIISDGALERLGVGSKGIYQPRG